MEKNCSRGSSAKVLTGYPGGLKSLSFEIFTPNSDLEKQNTPRARVGHIYSKVEAVYFKGVFFLRNTKNPTDLFIRQ